MSSPKTNALTYNGYVTQIGVLAVVNTTTSSGVVVGEDAAFNAIIPQMLNYAELRIQRDLDLMPSEIENTSYSLTSGNNKLTLSTNDFVTLQTVAVTSAGVMHPLLPTTKEFLQNVYPSASSAGLPRYFSIYAGDAATYGNTSLIVTVGPWPDAAYPVTLTGTTRMASLYTFANASDAGTETTWISTNLPDLLLMASMIYISGYQRNFGRQSDDPTMAVSYESQYQALLRGAMGEEGRKKFEGAAWSSASTAATATPTRG